MPMCQAGSSELEKQMHGARSRQEEPAATQRDEIW